VVESAYADSPSTAPAPDSRQVSRLTNDSKQVFHEQPIPLTVSATTKNHSPVSGRKTLSLYELIGLRPEVPHSFARGDSAALLVQTALFPQQRGSSCRSGG